MEQPRRIARTAVLAAAIAAFSLLSGCRRHHRIAHLPPPPPPAPKTSVPLGYTKVGIASWYGIPFDGHRAADGEIFHMNSMVAANRVLPFNTWLKVTNLANGKSVKVRIIDRGPFVHGRILDLSMGAARQIGLLRPGIGRVRIEVIAAPPSNPADEFYAVQVGAYSVRAHADRVAANYSRHYDTVRITVKYGRHPLWRVLVGREPSIDSARRLAASLRSQNKNVFIVRLDPSDFESQPGS